MSKTRKLSTDAMLAAMCAVLGYVALDMGNIKITFESLPVIISALLFGPVDGMAVGAVGTLIYQVLRYGVTVTTLLWILPYVLAGLFVGIVAWKKDFSLSRSRLIFTLVINELLITLLNTGAMYIDSIIFGYYSFAFLFGMFAVRITISIIKAIAFSFLVPIILKTIWSYKNA